MSSQASLCMSSRGFGAAPSGLIGRLQTSVEQSVEGAGRRALRRSVDGHCTNAGGSATLQVKSSLLGSSGREGVLARGRLLVKADSTRPPSRSTILRATVCTFLSAAGVMSLACRPPALIDPLGQPVSRPLLIASIEYGSAVIDSSSEGVRAIVEFTRTLPDSTYKEDGAVPLLRCSGRGAPLLPVRARSEPITCNERPPAAGCGGAGQANAPCNYPNRRIGRLCSQVLHLEYRLDAVPNIGDSLTLQVGDRLSRSRWTRP